MTPLVSVLMAVYNGERYLAAAINSILNQTFTNFEFIIINDGSTDNTINILSQYQKSDHRIHIYHQGNCGLTASLNKGFQLTKGKYIARMDADDISLPKRLAKQVAFMDANPEVGVCGTWLKTIGEVGGYVEKYPTDYKIIKAWLLFNSALAHPSVMMRKELFIRNNLSYNNSQLHCEDYGLWVESSKHFQMVNLGEILLLYRYHYCQVTQRHSQEVEVTFKRLIKTHLESLGIQPTQEELEIHNCFRTFNFKLNKDFFPSAHAWLYKIKNANDKNFIYDEVALANVLGYRWFLLCNTATELGWWIWETFWRSPFSKAANLSWQEQLKLAAKCQAKPKRKF
ncbi:MULTISPECIES: glycosyltransferase family 2 protein [Cyanophyceae]|uniref:glycosyltransferase family 2 protein n=1 Tax=Cyanophyceae TaxID=3028117 RepID=UPI00168474AC|nr:glycosyltransferase family 2 protein [Trichocoleus sp. FACHB-40]MBD2002388.1 glycosyltransferase family 2 protein [Trichocoleus sp. FACHB-40]